MKGKPILRLLFLEDLESDFELAITELQRSGLQFESLRVENKKTFLKEVVEFKPDIIISDYMMPTFTGMEALKLSLEFRPRIPFIILTGSMNEDTAVQCLRSGAADYVIKEHIARLPYSVKEILEQKELNAQKEKTEKALVESEKAYRLLFDSNPQPIWVFEDSTLNFLTVNEAAIEKYGYSKEEFLSLRLTDMIPSVDLEDFQTFDNENPEKTRKTKKIRHQLKDGSLRLVETTSNRIDFEGKKARLVLVNDVTDKVQAEEDLIRSEENFRRSIDESPLGIRIVSVSGKTIYANNAFLSIYEFSNLEKFNNTSAKDRYTPESYQLHQERKKIRKDGGDVTAYDLSIVRKNSEIRHIKVSRKEVIWNGTKHFQVINLDITEQKNAQEKLRKLSMAVEQSPDAIIITGPNANIEYANPKTLELTGYTNEELVGQNPRIFNSGEKSVDEYAQLWKTLWSGNVWTGEFHNKKKSGELYWESAIISPIFDNQGEITHFLAIKEDITADKKMLQDLIVAKEKAEESDQLKTAFLATMSHELRTPLNAVIGFSSLIDDELPMNQITNFAKIIHNSGNNLLNIIEGILDLTLLESKEAKVKAGHINLASFMTDLLELAKSEQVKFDTQQVEIEYVSYLGTEYGDLYSDKEKLTKVMVQLLKNALKFTSSGKIQFGYELESGEESDQIKFFVKDTGIGISETQISFIFNRFRQAEESYTRKYGGTGIGLTISKQIIELLGGRIWVESELGKGSSFYFTIPLSEKE